MSNTITLTASTIQDGTLYFDLVIDGTVVATVDRTLNNANLKTLIQAAYDKGATRANTKFDPALDDA